jgi:hypothetical protein
MFLLELFIALTIALLLSVLISKTVLRPIAQNYFVRIFLIIFLITWAGGVWIRPFGPSFYGIYWLPFTLSGVIASLLIATTAHGRLPKNRQETIELLVRVERGRKLNQLTGIILSLFLGVMLLLLLTTIIVRHISY